MTYRHLAGAAGLFALSLITTGAFPQTNDAASSGPAANGSPAWFLAPMQGMIETRAKPRPDAGLAGRPREILQRPERLYRALLPAAEQRAAVGAMQGVGGRRRSHGAEGQSGHAVLLPLAGLRSARRPWRQQAGREGGRVEADHGLQLRLSLRFTRGREIRHGRRRRS